MAISKPEPSDWAKVNAKELHASDREVLAMLRDSYRRVNDLLDELIARDSGLISDTQKRARLEASRSKLMAEQARVFTRLGDITAARRARSASRAARLSAASDAELLRKVGKGAEAQYLYDSLLQISQNAIDTALARMRLSELPLSERIYRSSVWMGGRLGKLINETLASGIDARAFAKRARDWFNPATPGGVRYAALRLARTEINNAFHAMTAKKAQDTPWIPNCEWHLSGSHPTPDECNAIAERDTGFGEGVYKSEDVPVRPHPQCMCYITPKPIDEDDFVENFLKGDYDDFLDKELEENGWDVKQKKPRTAPKAAPEPTPAAKAPRTFTNRFAEAAKEQAALDAVPLGIERRPRPESFTQDMVRGLNRYTGRWFEPINQLLRGQKLDDESERDRAAEMIGQIDPAFELSKTKQEAVAYRGISDGSALFGDRLNGDLTGMEWKEEAYVSTSALQRRISPFLRGRKGSTPVQMRLLIPEGTPAIEGSPFNAEAEILLGRGRNLRIAKDNGVDANGVRQIDVEVINVPAEPIDRSRGADEEAAGRDVQPASVDGSEGRTNSGYVAGNWKLQVGNEDVIRETAESLKKASKSLSDEEALEMATKFIEGTADESEIRLRNGPHEVRFSGKATEEEQKAFLAYVDRLQSRFPTGHNMHINVVPSTELEFGVGGETTLSTGYMRINERTLRQKTWASGMPISSKVASALYVLAHEWGHALSTKDEADDHHTHDHALESGGMTKYGSKDHNGKKVPREGYAEAFAEWALSEGKTTNPAALVYAEKFHWGERFGF
jgi:hypothetical protein